MTINLEKMCSCNITVFVHYLKQNIFLSFRNTWKSISFEAFREFLYSNAHIFQNVFYRLGKRVISCYKTFNLSHSLFSSSKTYRGTLRFFDDNENIRKILHGSILSKLLSSSPSPSKSEFTWISISSTDCSCWILFFSR